MRVINYIRLSSESQIDNQSAQIQYETNEHEIARYKDLGFINKHTQSEKVDDSGVSGLLPLEDRKFGKELLNLKENDFIFASHVDRLSRDNMVYANFIHACKIKKVNVIVPNSGNLTVGATADRAFLATMQAVFSEYTVKTTKQKCRAGSQKKRGHAYHDFPEFKNGMGGIVPYGYRKQGDGREALFVKESWLDDVINFIKKLHLEGKSLRLISEEVEKEYAEKIPSCSLTHQTVKKILMSSKEYESTLKINQEVI